MPRIAHFLGAVEGAEHHSDSGSGYASLVQLQQQNWHPFPSSRKDPHRLTALAFVPPSGGQAREARLAQATSFLHSHYVKDAATPETKPMLGDSLFRSWRLAVSGGGGVEAGAATTNAATIETAASAHRDGFIRANDLALIAGFFGLSTLVGLGYRALMTPTPLPKAPPRRGENQQQASVPDAATAAALKVDPPEYPEDKLIILADRGHNPAAAERLARNIMAVDGCDHDGATNKVGEIDMFHRQAVQGVIWLYFVGIGMASFSAFVAFPMVYSQGLTELTGLSIVSTDVPEPLEVHNMFKVSNWSWGWMEPLTGVASFVALMWQMKKQWADDIGVLDSYHTGKFLAVNGDGMTVLKKYNTYDSDALKSFVLTTENHEEPLLKD